MQTEPPKAEPPKRKRRWFQFSLRALLIFTVICAVAAGWLGETIERKRKEREAVAALVKLGGNVRYDYQRESGNPPGPDWLRGLLGADCFSEVDSVIFFPNVTGVTDAALENLKPLIQLQRLELWTGKDITDAGLVNLEGLAQLQMLGLRGTQISDAGLAHLAGLKRLRSLELTGTKISQGAVTDFQKALPNCKIQY
jgi:hypothetical protein